MIYDDFDKRGCFTMVTIILYNGHETLTCATIIEWAQDPNFYKHTEWARDPNFYRHSYSGHMTLAYRNLLTILVKQPLKSFLVLMHEYL